MPDVPAVIYVASDGEDWLSIRDTLRQVNSDFPLLVVWPRGIGEVPWPKKIRKDMLRNAMHVGRTPDSMRVWDIVRAAAFLREKVRERPIAVIGSGTSAALSLYAAGFDKQIDQVILINPPSTHYDRPTLLNVLRHTDLPEVAALIAPRKLTFYGGVPAPYEHTRKAYQTLGAADQFELSMGIESSLLGVDTIGHPSGQ
jgi:pimeloyl-ACP methyl ester carboxylesterase